MVDQDLQAASGEIAGEFQQLDLASVVVSVSGIGVGLFTAEFAAEFFGNLLTNAPGRARTGVEILSKFGMAGVHLLLRRFFGGPTVGVILALGALGSATSGALQLFETAVSAIQSGSVSAPAGNVQADMSQATQSPSASTEVTSDSASVSQEPAYSV